MRYLACLFLLSSLIPAQNPCSYNSPGNATVYDCPCGVNFPIISFVGSTAIGSLSALIMSNSTVTQPGSGWYFMGTLANPANSLPSGFIVCPNLTPVTHSYLNVTANQFTSYTGSYPGPWYPSTWWIFIPNNPALRGLSVFFSGLEERGTTGVFMMTPTIYITIT